MSFIDSWIQDIILVDKVGEMVLSIDNLRQALQGSASVFAASGVLHVSRQINEETGSTLLRKYIKTVESGQGSFTDTELKQIIFEVNYLLKNFNDSNTKVNSQSGAKSSKLATSLAKVIEARGNKSMLNSNGLEINARVWASTVLHYINMNGNANVKRCIKTEDDVLKYMELEGGLNSDGTVKVGVANSFGYCGPFQFGPAAWFTGPAKYSKYKWKDDRILSFKPIRLSADRYDMIRVTQANGKGGPGDLEVMGPGVVEFWNACWDQFLANARDSKMIRRFPGASSLVSRVPRTWQMLYAMHNAGATAAYTRLLGLRVNPVSDAQSVYAQQVGHQVLQQFKA